MARTDLGDQVDDRMFLVRCFVNCFFMIDGRVSSKGRDVRRKFLCNGFYYIFRTRLPTGGKASLALTLKHEKKDDAKPYQLQLNPEVHMGP